MPASPDPRVKYLIRFFVGVHDDGRWREARLRWPDEEEDGGIDAIAILGDVLLGIEHTLIEPFEGNLAEFAQLKKYFLRLEADATLKVPGVSSRVDVPRQALQRGSRCAELSDLLHEWLRAHLLDWPIDGKFSLHRCAPQLEIGIRRQPLPDSSAACFMVRRLANLDVPSTINKALRDKVKKLARTAASKRVLLFERGDWWSDEHEMIAEVRRRRSDWQELQFIDEIWIMETTPPGTADPDWLGCVDFKLYDLDDPERMVRSFVFLNGQLFEASQDGRTLAIERWNEPEE